MFAIDSEFVIRKGVCERYCPVEGFDGFSKFAGNEKRIAKGTLGYGKLCRIIVSLGQFDEFSGQCDCLRNRLAHQAGVPGDPLGGESAGGSVEPVRKLFGPQSALLDA
jgi:hypothetical protein